MLFTLTSRDGDTIEIERSAASPPKWGYRTRRNGKVYERLISAPAMSMARGADGAGATKAWSLPRKDAARAMGMPSYPHTDKDGFAVFRSSREREKWMKTKGESGKKPGDKYVFDRGGHIGGD